jgi:hypothetical protein
MENIIIILFLFKKIIYIYIILKYGKHQNNLIILERSNDTIWTALNKRLELKVSTKLNQSKHKEFI